MTKEEFIEGYVTRSDIERYRTADGFTVDGRITLAMPCNCEEEGCEGWQMVSKEIHDSWIKLAGPDYFERQRPLVTIDADQTPARPE